MAIGGDVLSGFVQDTTGVLVRLQPGQGEPQLERMCRNSQIWTLHEVFDEKLKRQQLPRVPPH